MSASPPLSIAVVIGKWHGYGVETLTLALAEQADPARVRFTFVIDEDSRNIPHGRIEASGSKYVVVPPYQRPIKHRQALIKLFKQEHFDIVHAHTSTLAVFPLSAAKTAKVPVRVAHVHTMAGKGEYLKNFLKFSLRPFAKTFANHLAASSMYAGEWLFGKKTMSTGEVFYLPVARDLEQFRFDPEERDRIRAELEVSDSFCIGHLGRFVAQKNHAFLVEVFKEVKKQNNNSFLVLAGDGELEDAVQEKIQKEKLSESVLFLGQRTDAPSLYQAFDVFVLPSLYEGVPGTGIEAQAAGLPFFYADTVTPEAKLLPTTHRLSLELGAKAWASEILRTVKETRLDNAIEILGQKGFSIDVASEMLTEFYERVATTGSLGEVAPS